MRMSSDSVSEEVSLLQPLEQRSSDCFTSSFYFSGRSNCLVISCSDFVGFSSTKDIETSIGVFGKSGVGPTGN